MLSILASLEAIPPATSTIVTTQSSGRQGEEMLMSYHDPKMRTLYSVEEISHCHVPAQVSSGMADEKEHGDNSTNRRLALGGPE